MKVIQNVGKQTDITSEKKYTKEAKCDEDPE